MNPAALRRGMQREVKGAPPAKANRESAADAGSSKNVSSNALKT
jgi:hypothetical protein